MPYYEQIKSFVPRSIQEEKEREIILEYIELIGDKILDRSSRLAHITSSGFIMNKELNKTLMIHHNIYDAWGWTGGHADGDRNLLEIAMKEAIEETGVSKVTPLSEKIATIDIIEVPAHFKNGEYISVHLHLNITYILIASEDEELFIKEDENSGVKWIGVEEIEEEVNEKRMIPIYKKIIERGSMFNR